MGTRFSARHIFYTLFLACGNVVRPLESLQEGLETELRGRGFEGFEQIRENFGVLLAAIDESSQDDEDGDESDQDRVSSTVPTDGPYSEFVKACLAGTNTKANRLQRFNWLTRALTTQIAV